MGNFRELKVWEKAHALTLAIYESTATFPKDERYGLIQKLTATPAHRDLRLETND